MYCKQKGFSLVEIIVVISILGILMSIVIFSFSDTRGSARDTVRMSDIDQIGLAMRMYAVQYGALPDCEGGTVLEAGRGPVYTGAPCADEELIKQYLEDYFGTIPTDPLGPDNSNYYYYYDSRHNCFTSGSAAMVFAVNLEEMSTNATEVCDVQSGNDGGYMNTSEINPSVPYVSLLGNA